MHRLVLLLLGSLVGLVFGITPLRQVLGADPMHVVFDTDITGDVDDVLALAIPMGPRQTIRVIETQRCLVSEPPRTICHSGKSN